MGDGVEVVARDVERVEARQVEPGDRADVAGLGVVDRLAASPVVDSLESAVPVVRAHTSLMGVSQSLWAWTRRPRRWNAHVS